MNVWLRELLRGRGWNHVDSLRRDAGSELDGASGGPLPALASLLSRAEKLSLPISSCFMVAEQTALFVVISW